ncbi:phage-related head-tail joining protein [Liquorilactobacillus aquaticus DSM 21051]|uniref:Phage-related head-tail joining protein n=1 Tax=Liquorilactobacillus aquaticus DSM 21051 TaxID=1423725 RepID=A0A0R2CWB5_9LACO|nr:HK97-gp10 family putative phage morphogenesis protein [Liquorilactobacillus aquaticus]KRM95959.1 phage-related head-tail joining protein [Liquorilactobacillus aquaticus DSM 21051]
MGLDDQLHDWLNSVEKKAINTEQQAQITEAGAKVFVKHLKAETEKHRSSHNDVKYGHLADNIVCQGTDIDKEKNGNSTVGFGKKAYVAGFLNDGTVNMKATHFVDNARRESRSEVFAAEKKKYEELTGGDG